MEVGLRKWGHIQLVTPRKKVGFLSIVSMSDDTWWAAHIHNESCTKSIMFMQRCWLIGRVKEAMKGQRESMTSDMKCVYLLPLTFNMAVSVTTFWPSRPLQMYVPESELRTSVMIRTPRKSSCERPFGSSPRSLLHRNKTWRNFHERQRSMSVYSRVQFEFHVSFMQF